MAHFISTLLSVCLLSYASARTCCYYIEDQPTCETLLTEENGPVCEWYGETSGLLEYDPISGRAIHCRSIGWGLCNGADPPADCATRNPHEPDCTDFLAEPEGADTNSVMETNPGDVHDQIDEAETTGCFVFGEENNPTNCYDPTRNDPNIYPSSDVAPNTLSFNAKTHNLDGDCCYTYDSVYTGAADCTGKSPEQSHILIHMDCDDESAFEITANNEEYTSFGPDGSTCYTGIKFDTGCDDGDCDYQVCIRYSDENVNAECPLADGWIMDKASNTFTFNALIQGVPSCNLPEDKKSRNHYLAVSRINAFKLHQTAQTGSRSMFMYVGAFVFALLCFAMWYWSGGASEAYKAIKDPSQTDYATFTQQTV